MKLNPYNNSHKDITVSDTQGREWDQWHQNATTPRYKPMEKQQHRRRPPYSHRPSPRHPHRSTSPQHRNQDHQVTDNTIWRTHGDSTTFLNQKDGFLNFAGINLTEDQITLLNLGINCHVMSRPSEMAWKVELEILLDDIVDLDKQKKVTTKDILQAELIAEGGKIRVTTEAPYCSPSTKRQLRAFVRTRR